VNWRGQPLVSVMVVWLEQACSSGRCHIVGGSTDFGFNRLRVQLHLIPVGFHHSGSHHSGLSHAPSIRVSGNMQVPLSERKQWGSRS
jgi:hypothetical protein